MTPFTLYPAEAKRSLPLATVLFLSVSTAASALASGRLTEPVFQTRGEKHINKAPYVFVAEHAGKGLLKHRSATQDDHRYLNGHHGYDIGARATWGHIAARTRSPIVLGTLSRLVFDLSRPKGDKNAIRREVEGHSLSFNQDLTMREVALRHKIHDVFHGEIDRLIEARKAAGGRFVWISGHTMTDHLRDHKRDYEVDIIRGQHNGELAQAIFDEFQAQGFDVRMEEAYSLRRIHTAGQTKSTSVEVHEPYFLVSQVARRHGNGKPDGDLDNIEIEFVNSHVDTPKKARAFAERTTNVFLELARKLNLGPDTLE